MMGTLSDKIQDQIFGHITNGTDIEENIEQFRKKFLINFILIVGGTFLSFLTTVAFLQHYLLLGAVDLIILGFVIILFIRVRKSTDTKQLEFIGTIGIGLFYFFLIAYGGVNTTAFMWAFTYPLISLSLLGPRLGTLMSMFLLGVAGIVFTIGPHVQILAFYNTDLIIRFIMAYLTILFIALVMEMTRGYVQGRLKLSNRKLGKAFNKVQEKSTALFTSNQELKKEVEERLRVEKALRDSEHFLDNIIESIQDGISVLEPDLTIRHVNSVMTDWYNDNAPLIGKKCYESYHNSTSPCEKCPTLRCLTSGHTEVEIVPGPTSSSVEWLELFSYPIADQESGKITGVVEFVRDITERKRMEDQLSQAQRMDSIGRLAGGVAHDFNNILMGVQGRVSLMFSESGVENTSNEHLQSIELYVQKATELTRQLLGFARGGKYEIQPVNISRLVEENIDLFSRTRKELLVINPAI
jgi:PAS domain S-box-containing protein